VTYPGDIYRKLDKISHLNMKANNSTVDMT